MSIRPISLASIPEDGLLSDHLDPPPPNIFDVHTLKELKQFGYSLSYEEIVEIEDAGEDSKDELSAMNYAAARIALGRGDPKLFRVTTFHCPDHFEEIDDILRVFRRCITDETKKQRAPSLQEQPSHYALAKQAMKEFDVDLFQRSISHLRSSDLLYLNFILETFQKILGTASL